MARITILLLLIFMTFAPLQAKEQRQALVIGNADYQIGKLKNPLNDARDIAKRLKGQGFEVTQLLNADQRKMERAIKEFTRGLGEDKVGLFYYAGHAIEVDGQNFLIPIGAQIDSEEDVKYEAVHAGRVLDGMKQADNGLNLVILDACRNNPYSRGFRSASRGLARMTPASGSLILYATEPGDVAADGDGRNGLFTQHLLAALDQPGLTAEQVFKQTAQRVRKASGGSQTPWMEGVILGQFYFIPAPPGAPGAQPIPPGGIPIQPNPQQARELAFWQSVEARPSLAGYEAYLQTYPNGGFAALARVRIGELKAQQAPPEPETLALTVEPTPRDARVRILNIGPKYRDGIELEPGRYHLEVSSPGYQAHTHWFELRKGNRVYSVTLEKKDLQAAETIPEQPGMPVEADVEVSEEEKFTGPSATPKQKPSHLPQRQSSMQAKVYEAFAMKRDVVRLFRDILFKARLSQTDIRFLASEEAAKMRRDEGMNYDIRGCWLLLEVSDHKSAKACFVKYYKNHQEAEALRGIIEVYERSE